MNQEKTKRLLAGLVAVTVTASLAFTGCSPKAETPDDTKAPAVETPAEKPEGDTAEAGTPITTIDHVDADGVFIPHDYEVADMTPEDGALVIASCSDTDMDNILLSYYYWQQYFTFLNQYGQYASMMMDFSIPLSEQMMSETKSFQDTYIEAATEAFHAETAAYYEAMANDFVLNEEAQAYLDSMEDDMNEYVAASGFADGAAYLTQMFGDQFTMEMYKESVKKSLIGNAYMSEKAREIDISLEAKEAYYNEHTEDFAAQGISMEEKNPVNVRHLLVMPKADEGAEVDETGAPVLTEENWSAAEAEANRLYEEWLNGDATEDSFAALATEYTEDGGSAQTGGLYENVYMGQMVPEFEAWSFDDARVFGDTGIVKTSYGYHIMFFVSQSDTPRWPAVAESMMLNGEFTRLYEVAKETYPLTVDYTNVKLFPSPAETENRDAALAQKAGAEG